MPNVIGAPLTRVDGRLKVTGKATYSAEFNIPHLTYAVLVTSTIPRGRIASLETSRAEHTPGVLAVLTHKSGLKVAKDPMDISGGGPVDRALQLLQDDRVYYSNQPVALVVGETFEAAREGAGLVAITYAPELHAVDLDHGLGTATIPEKMGGAGDPGQSSRGDMEAGLRHADIHLEQTYTTPFQVHNPLEPHATIALWEAPDRLTLYDCSQGIFGDRKRVAELLGLRPEQVHVVSLYLGGGFGSKGPTWSHTVLCALAARHVKRPVKLVLARPQMFGEVGCRSETRQKIAIGAKRDGTLTALRNDTWTHTSSFDQFVETASLPSRMLYSVPNNVTVQRLVKSDIGTPSYMRAPGEAPGTFALEVAMDELAVALRIDPIELRLRNYAQQDEEKNQPFSSKSLRECYRLGADRFGWAKRNPQPGSMRQGDTLIGWGMATALYPARRSPSAARARMNADGTVLVEAGTQELGGGTYTIMTQIAADALGVAPARVAFRLGDTRYPETPVSGGSQTTASTGTAVQLSARALREKLVQMAVADSRSPVHNAGHQDVGIEDGRLFVTSDRARGEALTALLARAGQPFIEAQTATPTNEDAKKYAMYSFGAQFAEVHVDAALGQLRVARMLGVFATGRIMNAKTARSQFLGGMIWGISFALYEHAVYDERLGRIVNNNLAEYHVPTNADVGEIDALWVDETDEHVSTMGAKGIGEIGITGSAAAVANAVFHATGKRIRELPITPDKLL